MAGFIDIGVNLTHDSFDHDREAVIARARAAGITAMLVTGTSVPVSTASLDLAGRTEFPLYATVGVHPHHAREFDAETPATLRRLLGHPRAVAVGECGLDFFRNFSPPADQERAFAAQLALAAETGKPVFLHQRDAHARFIAILSEYRRHLAGAVLHCFTGSAAELDDCLALDLYIGITGWICDERRGLHLRELVRSIPKDRLLIETDAPYLIPRSLRPRPTSNRNEPAYLAEVARIVAECIGIGVPELARLTTDNARRLFRLP